MPEAASPVLEFQNREPAEPSALTQGAIFRLYLPLAVSWIFMSFETPVAAFFLSRMAGADVNSAAFFVMMSLSIWIESPVIDLLATSTTLAKNRTRFLVLRRFALTVIVGVTLVHALVSMTPLYWLIARDWLHQAPEVREAMRIPFILMLPWSGFIGWRRFLQGVLIRHGSTAIIGWGTLVRLSTIALFSYGLCFHTALPGLVAISMAVTSSVIAESLFVHFVGRPIVYRSLECARASDENEEPLNLRKVAGFHLPLTASTMTAGLSQPLVSAALALTALPVLAPAAWLVTLTLFSPLRSITYALTEPTIALYKDRQSLAQLRRFAWSVGLFCGGVIFLAALTRFDLFFFQQILSYTSQEARLAHVGMYTCSLLPVITALMMHLRGILTAHHQTPSRLLSIGVGLAFLCGVLALGVRLHWPGPMVAGAGVTVAMLAECGTLLAAWRRLVVTGRLGAPSAA